MKIYLAQQEGTNYFKIGVTRKPITERLKELQTGNANILLPIYEFKTKYDFKLETALHAHYRLKKVNLEWFELSSEEISDFLNICEKYEKIYETLKDNPFI